jgi:hypothetical protein
MLRFDLPDGTTFTATVREAPAVPPDEVKSLALTLQQAQLLADSLVPVGTAALPIKTLRGLIAAARARLERMARADT